MLQKNAPFKALERWVGPEVGTAGSVDFASRADGRALWTGVLGKTRSSRGLFSTSTPAVSFFSLV